jgi:hypothetical protein
LYASHGRLLPPCSRGDKLKEGVRGGTRGSPTVLSTATGRLRACRDRRLTYGLDEILVVSPLVGDEELAMGALEALMAIGAAREQLGLEGLLAVGANDLERAFLLNPAAHTARIAL